MSEKQNISEADMESFRIALERIVDGTTCAHCGAEVRLFRQVGRSYYADPCGHRQGQGRASFFNAKIAAKRGLTCQTE